MLTRVAGMVASLVLVDGAVLAAAAGVSSLVRQLWPVRRKPARPLAAVAAAVTALALAVTGRRVPCDAAEILLATLAAGWLTATTGHAWSRVRVAGWRALRRRRKAPLRSHLYIWVDGVAATAMVAFTERQFLAAWVTTAIFGLLAAAVSSARVGRTRDSGTVALWTRTRRPTPPWPGVTAKPANRIGDPDLGQPQRGATAPSARLAQP
jgi:hypothetical protein